MAIGILILAFGIFRESRETQGFANAFDVASGEDELRLVNHTISEEEMKEEINRLITEINDIKKTISREDDRIENLEKKITRPKNEIKETTAETYKEVADMIDDTNRAKTIDELSKEMEMGKGELQLLKKLRGR